MHRGRENTNRKCGIGLGLLFTPPWLSQVQSTLSQLNNMTVPANMSAAKSALLTTGNTIVSQVNSGVTVNDDDALNWLAQVSHLAALAGNSALANQPPPDTGILADTASNIQNLPEQTGYLVGDAAQGIATGAGQVATGVGTGLFHGLSQSPVGMAILIGGGIFALLMAKKALE